MQFRWRGAGAVAAVLVLASMPGCTSPAAVGPDACGKDALQTLQHGFFTFATDEPAYPPWYLDDDPAGGAGFESAVAYAVADRLGYSAADVHWVRVPFNTAMAPGPKQFDAALSQFSITDQRRELVDFSPPYYDVAQAVVTVRSSPAAEVTTLAGLRAVRLGAEVGTTSSAAARAVGAETPISVYDNNIEAKAALRSGQIDALVLDLPTAWTVRDELGDGLILGRLPAGAAKVEQLGILLDKDSPLTPCVSAAVTGLRTDGTLEDLQRRWLAGAYLPAVLM